MRWRSLPCGAKLPTSASVLVQAGVAKDNADKLIQEAKEAHGDRDKRRKTAAGSATAA